MIPLAVATNEEQEKEIRRLIKSCAEYIMAMRCQIERQKQAPAVFFIFLANLHRTSSESLSSAATCAYARSRTATGSWA